MNQNIFLLSNRTDGQPFRLISAAKVQAKPGIDLYERVNYGECTIEYILQGSGYLEINGKSFKPEKDGIYILHKRSSHKYWPDDDTPWKKLFFVVDGWLMDSLFQAYGLSDIYHIPGCQSLKHYFDKMFFLARSKPVNLQEKAVINFHNLLIRVKKIIGSHGESHSPLVESVQLFIEKNIARTISMRELAEHAHKSVSHLTRLFKAETGATPYEYLLQQRIEAAKALLITTKMPVKNISSQLGFSDQYYFCNIFKKRTGMAPSHYREHKPMK